MDEYLKAIMEAEKKYGIPSGLLKALIAQESNFNPRAISNKGALGIAQIMPSMHPGVDPFDPIASIDYAGKFLKENYDTLGDWDLALAGYNAGPGAVQKYKGIPPYKETQDYVSSINKRTGRTGGAGPSIEGGQAVKVAQEQEVDEFDNIINSLRSSLKFSEGDNVLDNLKSEYENSRIKPELQEVDEKPNIISEIFKEGVSGTLNLGRKVLFGQNEQEESETLSKMTPEQQAKFLELKEYASKDVLWLLKLVGGVGAGAGLGKLGLLRKGAAGRTPGSKLADMLPTVDETAVNKLVSGTLPKQSGRITPDDVMSTGGNIGSFISGADDAVRGGNKLYETGVKLWGASLRPRYNPSQLSRHMSSLDEAGQFETRMGMLEGLTENLRNFPRITKEVQANLQSPAGKAMLKEVLTDMPPQLFDEFMLMVERGKWVDVRNWMIRISLAIPALRYAGEPVWRAIVGERNP